MSHRTAIALPSLHFESDHFFAAGVLYHIGQDAGFVNCRRADGKLAFANDVYGLDPAPAALAATGPATDASKADPAQTASATAH